MIKALSKKLGLVLAVVSAAIVGGATTAVVLAAIPDSGGTIHGCYRNNAGFTDPKGALRVIDSDLNQACTAQETALNWSNGGSGSGGPKGYAFGVDNIWGGGTVTLDAARTKNIIMPDPQYPFCFTLTTGTPTSVSVANGTFAAFKDQNGWTDTGNPIARCASVPSANLYIEFRSPGASGSGSFVTVF